MLLEECADLEIGIPHSQPEIFRFLGSSDNAAIVVGQNDDRPTPEFWSEKHFYRCKTVIAVDQGIRRASVIGNVDHGD